MAIRYTDITQPSIPNVDLANDICRRHNVEVFVNGTPTPAVGLLPDIRGLIVHDVYVTQWLFFKRKITIEGDFHNTSSLMDALCSIFKERALYRKGPKGFVRYYYRYIKPEPDPEDPTSIQVSGQQIPAIAEIKEPVAEISVEQKPEVEQSTPVEQKPESIWDVIT